MDRQRFLPLAMVILTLARWLLMPLAELSPPEAHAAMCAREFDLWHPLTGPVLPLLMKASISVFGWNEFGVRFFAPLLMLAAGWLVWRIALGLFGETVAAWSLVIFQTAPAVNLASVTFTTTTLGIFESAGLLALLRLALHRRWRFHLQWWAVALAVIVAFYTDWRLIMFPLAGTASLVLTRRGRAAMMKWPVLPVLAGTFALAVTIFLAWNSEHGWTAFRMFRDPSTSPFKTALRVALLAHGPVFLLLTAWALAQTALSRPLSYATAFLFAFALPMFTLDLFTTPDNTWPQAAFSAWIPPLAMLAASHLVTMEKFPMRLKIGLRSAAVILSVIQSCFILQNASAPRVHLPWQNETQREFAGWRAMADEIREAVKREKLERGKFFVVTDRWQFAAPLAFYMPELQWDRPFPSQPRVHVLPDDAGRTPFAMWGRFDSGKEKSLFDKATLIYITDDAPRHSPARALRESRPDCRLIAHSAITQGDETLRVVKVFACAPLAVADK